MKTSFTPIIDCVKLFTCVLFCLSKVSRGKNEALDGFSPCFNTIILVLAVVFAWFLYLRNLDKGLNSFEGILRNILIQTSRLSEIIDSHYLLLVWITDETHIIVVFWKFQISLVTIFIIGNTILVVSSLVMPKLTPLMLSFDQMSWWLYFFKL
jgi:hypothetical protein